ncbi:GAF and ANTAR domain-containing protein [Actinomycetospora sp.]|jgi:hypothetical protein|uniref:GAF and ANTAR domain-containing protein n=1 Tax=Actinomycetospora sp. TaxID=1872135 RepID=UPI002F401596
MSSNEELVVALRNAATELAARHNLRDFERSLADIVTAAVATVPGVDAGGVTMTVNDALTSRTPTHESVSKLDRLQSELGEGPCITATIEPPEDGVVVAHDLAGVDARRWPQFAPLAVECGYRSLLSAQLSLDGSVRAALNLYAVEPGVFDEEARLIAALFGVQAAMLLYGSAQAGYLQRAVESRDLIGQAKGILMERFTVDADGAFHMLLRSSQDTNLKLVDVARWVTTQADERFERTRSIPAADDS